MLEVAKKATVLAGRKIVSLRKKGLTFKSKKRLGDIATDADITSEKIINKINPGMMKSIFRITTLFPKRLERQIAAPNIHG